MKITVKLMGMLKSKMPPDRLLKLPDDATIADALTALEIPEDSVHVFTVNGKLERDKQRVLAGGDDFSVLPPVGGG